MVASPVIINDEQADNETVAVNIEADVNTTVKKAIKRPVEDDGVDDIAAVEADGDAGDEPASKTRKESDDGQEQENVVNELIENSDFAENIKNGVESELTDESNGVESEQKEESNGVESEQTDESNGVESEQKEQLNGLEYEHNEESNEGESEPKEDESKIAEEDSADGKVADE